MNRLRVGAAALVIAGALALGGCAPPAQPTAWQATVETVADQAAGGDYAGALASLDALEAEVVARRDAGDLAADEVERIFAAIAAVRTDLTSSSPHRLRPPPRSRRRNRRSRRPRRTTTATTIRTTRRRRPTTRRPAAARNRSRGTGTPGRVMTTATGTPGRQQQRQRERQAGTGCGHLAQRARLTRAEDSGRPRQGLICARSPGRAERAPQRARIARCRAE